MKAEFTNLFRVAVNIDANEATILFEQAQPFMKPIDEGAKEVVVTRDSAVEVASVVMSISCASNLIKELSSLLQTKTGEEEES